MARKSADAGGPQGILVDRRRNDAADVAVPRQSDRGNDGVVRRAPADRPTPG